MTTAVSGKWCNRFLGAAVVSLVVQFIAVAASVATGFPDWGDILVYTTCGTTLILAFLSFVFGWREGVF